MVGIEQAQAAIRTIKTTLRDTGLPEFYAASESRPALRDYLPRALAELVAKGGQEVIFIDGLDQLEEERSGTRDLSFLPPNPPAGVVFVLGTRPNDTLKPVELFKPLDKYELPGMSPEDFALVLAHRHVTLDAGPAGRFYTAMHANALYLDLAAKELAEAGAAAPETIIARGRQPRQPVDLRNRSSEASGS